MNIKKIIQEEINDFGWVNDINPTLFEYFENGLLEVGDVVTVRGETLDTDGVPVFLDKGKYLITHLDEFGPSKSNKFIRSKVVFDNETQQKLDIYKEAPLIEEDKGLEVLDHQRGGTMDMGDNILRENDGDDLDWVREVEPKRIEPCVKRGKCKEYVITGLENLSSNKVLEVLSTVNDLGWDTRDFEDWWDYEDLCYFYLERRGNCNWDDCELGYHEEDGEYYNYEEITPQDILNVVPQEKGLWGRYIDKLNESDDLDWIREIPVLDIRPGYVIDVKNSMTPPEEILKGLCREGYEWIRGDKICDENGEIIDIFSEWNRTIKKDLNFIVIGYAKLEDDDYDSLPAKQILYTEHRFQAEKWGPMYTV